MSSIEGRRIEIREGNNTLRGLMAGALGDLGFGISTDDDDVLDLLIVDIDSGLPSLDERAQAYAEEERPVITCGVRASRERYEDAIWLERPFTRFQLFEVVVDELGIDREEVEALLATPPTVDELPGPITRELDGEAAQELEEKFGLDSGVIDGMSELDVGDEDSDATYVLDPEEDELVMAVELAGEGGGILHSGVVARTVTEDELRNTADQELVHRGFRSPTFNQTMPETPAAIDHHDESTRETSLDGAILGVTEVGGGPESLVPPLEPDSDRAAVENDVASQFRGVARVLAESWDRLGLTARTSDRADRIERILRAALSRGVKGATEEIMRVPATQGFSGSLAAMPAIDLLRTIRDRRLQGRLEIASHRHAFVLYLSGSWLEEIDILSGNASSEEVLLEVLHNSGALEEGIYRELRDGYASGEMMLPLETKLSRDNLVSTGALHEARSARAKAYFRQICSLRSGQFAFIEVQPGDGAPWPVDPLRLSVDSVLLELLREASFDTGDSRATSRTRLVLDPARAAAVQPSKLTPTELRVLDLFRNPETVGQARDMMAKMTPEEVDRIVNRMKQLEILRRSDPMIRVPEGVRDAASEHTSDTVVSDIADVIGEERARQTTAPVQPAVTKDEQATEQKASFDLGIVADEIDDAEMESLVADGIAAYESSEPETDSDD